MAKININFNDKNYQIDEDSLSAATTALTSHLSTVMNGSGATINLGGTVYNIDSAKLSAATNAFVSHLGTVAGGNAGGDTLTWDGNTDGREKITMLNGKDYYRVSDAVLLETDLLNGFSVGNADLGEVVDHPYTEGSVMAVGGVLVLADEGVLAIPTDNCDLIVDGQVLMTFAKKGIYFRDYVTSITIPNYTGFGGGSGSKVTVNGVEYSIDPTKVASAVSELETVFGELNSGDVGGCDTLYWDGNTEGQEIVADSFIWVSDAVPTMADLESCVWRNADDERELGGTFNDLGGVLLNDYVAVIPHDNFVIEDAGVSFEKKGVYFTVVYGAQSLTIPGYTGFPHSEHCGH